MKNSMNENEIIEMFKETTTGEKCPKCGSKLTGGYYDPEELVKGPSDGVIAIKVPIEAVLKEETKYINSLALYVECKQFGRNCGFREPFYRFYKKTKKTDKIR